MTTTTTWSMHYNLYQWLFHRLISVSKNNKRRNRRRFAGQLLIRRKATFVWMACCCLTMTATTTSCRGAWVDNFIIPGTALTYSPLSSRSSSISTTEHVVIFEHTSHGAGGLVLNRPTPIVLRDLKIPRFSNGVFGQHRLYFGCGILSSPVTSARTKGKLKQGNDEEESEDEQDRGYSQVAIGDMSPWFWIHDLPRIPGSYLLEGAAEPLYMGGNVDIASERLIQQKNVDPKAHFKFFWKAKVWAPGKLEDELEQGLWKATGPLSANQAFLL